MKRLHGDGKQVTMSDNQKRILQIDDFISRAIREDFNDCGVPVNFEVTEWGNIPVCEEERKAVLKSKAKFSRFMRKMG